MGIKCVSSGLFTKCYVVIKFIWTPNFVLADSFQMWK